MRARARVMGEIEEVQEQMNANMEAMKELMATMMEAMMSMKKIMEVNRGAVAATSVATEVDPTHSSGLNQEALGSTGSPHFVQVQNKHAFPLYGLPPNYTAPNVAHTPDEKVNNSTPILIESQKPQSDHARPSTHGGDT